MGWKIWFLLSQENFVVFLAELERKRREEVDRLPLPS